MEYEVVKEKGGQYYITKDGKAVPGSYGDKKKVIKQAARLCLSKAHYFAAELEKLGLKLKYEGEFFHEFVTETKDADKILAALAEADILGGQPVEGGILWCVTELVSKEQLDKACAIIKEVL